MVVDANDCARLMLRHLVDEHSRQGAVRVLRHDVLDLSSDDLSGSILARYRFDEVNLDVAIDI